MPTYPTHEEFVELLANRSLRDVVDEHILEGLPFVFQGDQAKYELLLDHLAEGLGVPQQDLTMVGSGRTGFSLDPDEYGQPFRDSSDLDIVVVSPALFDACWLDLLKHRRAYVYRKIPAWVQEWHRDHERHVYRGKIWPHKLPGIVQLSGQWFNVFKSVGAYPELATHEVHGLLYRTWEHARLYHIHGLRLIKRNQPG